MHAIKKKDIPPYDLIWHGLELVLHLLQQSLDLWNKKQKYNESD